MRKKSYMTFSSSKFNTQTPFFIPELSCFLRNCGNPANREKQWMFLKLFATQSFGIFQHEMPPKIRFNVLSTRLLVMYYLHVVCDCGVKPQKCLLK